MKGRVLSVVGGMFALTAWFNPKPRDEKVTT